MENPASEARSSSGSTISAEEEEFYVQFKQHGSHTEADKERYESIKRKLGLLIEKATINLQLALSTVKSQPRTPPTPETLPTQEHLAEMKDFEMRLRQALEQFGLLLRLGIGGLKLEEFADQGWAQLAVLIDLQRQPHRHAEALRIHISLLSKSLARIGPYHESSIACLVNFASAIILQEGWPDSGPILNRLRKALINGLQQNHGPARTIEPLVREQIAVCNAAAAQQGDKSATNDAKQQLAYYLKDLGNCLRQQSKYSEAEAVLEKALHIPMEQEGFKPAEQRLAEMEGVSAKCLKAKMKEAAIAIPGGLEMSEIKKLYVQESNIKKCTFPEKLLTVETLQRQVIDALLRHPEGGPDSENVLDMMSDLKDTLAGQHKYREALSIGEKALSTYKRLFKDANHPRFKKILERQQEDLRLQKAFWREAEAVLSPKSTWIGDEDRQPASIMFEKTIEDARKRRATGSSSSSCSNDRDALGRNYAEFDPNDLMDMHLGAVLAALGVTGVYGRGQETIYSFFGPQVFKDIDTDKSTQGWAAVIALLLSSLPRQRTPGMSAIDIKVGAIGEAMSLNSKLMGEAKEKMQHLAASSTEAQREEEEEEKRESAAGSEQQRDGPIPRRTKPKRTCIACGAFGARKKCSRCNQAFACDTECFLSAWNASHRHSCVKQVE